MEVTGGALSVSKSWWYLIEYVWKRGQQVATNAESELDLVDTDSSGNTVSLKRLHCDESSKMLGLWLELDGNQVKLIEDLKYLDSEFNQNNKRMGTDAIHNARQLNKIAPEQFAKKGTASIDQTICKRCMIDHHKSKHLCFALTSSDLTGCYGRILHSAAALALLRVGISHNRSKPMFASIQNMIHKISTSLGDSEISFGGEDIGDWGNFPQGNSTRKRKWAGYWVYFELSYI